MKTYSIEKEKNICSRCGDSTDKLTYVGENRFFCKDCDDLYMEFLLTLEQKKLDDQDLLDSMAF